MRTVLVHLESWIIAVDQPATKTTIGVIIRSGRRADRYCYQLLNINLEELSEPLSTIGLARATIEQWAADRVTRPHIGDTLLTSDGACKVISRSAPDADGNGPVYVRFLADGTRGLLDTSIDEALLIGAAS
ncbi:hypothetical protein ACGFIF_43100 [Kribbella sp. NPDC049174]|uniref:hypothetical protein n=1 Tax=Kribbella sp. NPDC049174 TaxID=3364112 RepID=UPI0037167B7C